MLKENTKKNIKASLKVRLGGLSVLSVIINVFTQMPSDYEFKDALNFKNSF